MPEADLKPRLAAWLADRRPDWQDVSIDALRLDHGGGWSADIFILDASSQQGSHRVQHALVVRRQGGAFELVLGGELELQAKVMAALGRHPSVHAPALIGVELDPDLLGAPFLVMERVAGHAATQAPNYNVSGWLADMNPEQRHGCWLQGIQGFAALHRIDWHDGFRFLDRSERGEPGLDQYLRYLTEWYEWAAQGRPQPIIEKAMDYLLRARPQNAEVSVLWGDATPSNTLFRPDGSVAALIDWELATLGPGEIDLAWWLYFDELFSTGFGVARLAGLPDRDESISIYESAVGRRVNHMDYYDILTGVRMAIVCVRQFDRQVSLGNIAANNVSMTNNLMTCHLARRLGLPEPEMGDDFKAFLGGHIHKET